MKTPVRPGLVAMLGGIAAGAIAVALRRRGGSAADAGEEAVVTYHPEATAAGLAVLRAGGNAFDAFIAATMAEYVVAEGGTSLAGPLGVMVYDAKRQRVEYLDAEFNEVRHKHGRWQAGEPVGKAILVPGAPAGLEALSARHGRLKFAACLEPAIRLALDGFALTELYCRNIDLRAATLRSTEYGRKMFFRSGLALEPGDQLRQPALAEMLQMLARKGAAYMYRGSWASHFVEAARAEGSAITADDLKAYRADWREPWKTTYRGYTMWTCSGRTFGGLWALLCLKVVEHANLRALGHFSRSADALELLVRTARQVWEELWLLDYRLLEDREYVEARLTSKYCARVWHKVQARTATDAVRTTGTHSYHIIVLDRDGNLASGTNTHESLAWGSGVFVDGVPLPASGYLPWNTRRGERRISPFSMLLAFDDRALRFATGSFSSSILEASLQFMVNLIDYRLCAHDAATWPRFGTCPHDPTAFLSADAGVSAVDYASNWLDPRVSAEVVAAVRQRGLKLTPDATPRGDTGLGALLAVRPGGSVEGATAPWTS